MILSLDYTVIGSRIASMPIEELAKKLIERYPVKDLDITTVRWIYTHLLDVTAKAELLTEWVIKSVYHGRGRFEDINRFENMARFYFNVKATPKFKKIAIEYAQNEGKPINPKNILDFDLWDLEEIYELYEQPEVDPWVHQLGGKLPKGARLIYNNSNYQIVEIVTSQAACELAKGTKWCTSDPDIAEGYLFTDEYEEEDVTTYPLYIIYIKGKKYAQMYINDNSGDVQLMDLRDRPVLPDKNLGQVLWDSGLLKRALDSLEASIGDRLMDDPEYVERWTRFPQKEVADYISKKPYFAASYAVHMLHERWPQAERAILTRKLAALYYWKEIFNGGRWDLLESLFTGKLKIPVFGNWSQNQYLIFDYWQHSFKGHRWTEMEGVLLVNPGVMDGYISEVREFHPEEYEKLLQEMGVK